MCFWLGFGCAFLTAGIVSLVFFCVALARAPTVETDGSDDEA